MNNILLIALAAGVFFWAKSGNQTLNLVPSFQNIKLQKLSLTQFKMSMDLILENPNRRDVVFNEIYGTVYYKGNQIGTFSLYNQNIRVPARMQAEIPGINIKIEVLQILSELIDIVTGKGTTSVVIRGTLRANGFSYPFDITRSLS